MRSTLDHPSVINAYLKNEVSCGCVAGPFTSQPLTNLHISNFGVVPVILLGPCLVAQTSPQVEWALLLPDARMHSGLWSHLPEPGVLQSMVCISATPVLCTRSSSPFCGCILRGSQWSSTRVKFMCTYELVVAVLSSSSSAD